MLFLPHCAALSVRAGIGLGRAIGDMGETQLGSSTTFFQPKDPAVRYALMGSILLGISCGLLGSFIVVRKMALFGDTLSHAVLWGWRWGSCGT